ncbi:hypothetical protein [Burkholderia pseudomallei]|uniref:hypothetical protein n=1 Tax=Burkholderia pseudomallei TaxID=28450 RepID=UPI0012B1217C|nr:hypothetical protein [Burkholderia pseudomallei]
MESTESPPSEAAIVERMLSFCNEAYFTVALQHRRLQTTEPEDAVFVFRWWSDLQFLVVALRRLRRSAAIGIRVSAVSERISLAVRSFDSRLPDLAKMRNIGEHVDEYAVDAPRRHYGDVGRRQLQVGTWDGKVYRWIGELDVDVAKEAAEQLLYEVREAVRGFDEPVSGLTPD